MHAQAQGSVCNERGKRQFSTVLSRNDKCKWFPLAVCVCVVNFMSQQVECAVKATRGEDDVVVCGGGGRRDSNTMPQRLRPLLTHSSRFSSFAFHFFCPLGKHEIASSFECVCVCVRVNACAGVCVCTLRVRVPAWQCAKK